MITSKKQTDGRPTEASYILNLEIKSALLLVILSIFFIAAWMTLAPQYSAVIATADVALKGHKQTLQHQERAHIAEVFIEEGDAVYKGQTVIRLDDQELQILARSLDEQWFEHQLQLAFLKATINNKKQLIIPDHIVKLANELQLIPKLVNRQHRYNTQTSHLRRELALLDIQYQRHQQHAQSRDNERQRVLQQLSLMQPELRAIEQLSASQMVAKNSILKLRVTALELTKNSEKLSSEANQSRLLIKQTALEKEQRKQQLILSSQNEQRQINRNLPRLIKERKIIQQKLGRLHIKAPIDGRVQNLHVNAVGSQLEADQPIMEIIPSSATLLIEAKIAPQDIDKVLNSKQARVRLSAYNSRQTPLLNAEILRLSAHIFQDTQGHKFYRLLLRIPASQLERVPYVDLYPGMPAEVIVISKARTILQYLFEQLSQTSQRSLREA